MKRLIFIILLSTAATYSQNVSPQFSELKGMEDQSGNTHLFYRIYSLTKDNNENLWIRNDIYSYDLSSGIDTLFLNDYVNSSPGSTFFLRVGDYDFWNNNISWFIYCGWGGDFHPIPYIMRFDNDQGSYFAHNGSVNNIDISKQNDSLVFAGGWASNFGSEYERTFKSTDGGFTWQLISDSLEFLSLNPFYDNIHFANFEYEFSDLDDELYITTDGGNSYSLVDTSKRQFQTSFDEFLYDVDRLHLYRVYESKYGNYLLKVSSNKGNPFTWTEKYSSTKILFVSLDDSISGLVYLSSGKNIFLSPDYGDNFTLYKSLDRNIIGIYKKPNSNKLYAATKYKIYEITSDSIQVIKSMPIPNEIFSYYPLQIGNTWVYDYEHYDFLSTYHSDIFTRTIVDKVVKENGNTYYEIEEKYIYMGEYNVVYERIDSVTAKIYRFDEYCTDSEQLIDDLLAEVGDLLYSTRFGHCIAQQPTNFLSELSFNQWGITSIKKEFVNNGLFTAGYFLAGKIGLLSINYSDDNGNEFYNLNGAIIKGIVYGDTTVVSVEDETQNLPTEFSLSQNYPNPFNPSTSIQYAVSSRQFVSLKVYDVLGNEIATLVNEEKPAGEYEVEFNPASGIKYPASGVYFYQLKAGTFIQTKKMILLK